MSRRSRSGSARATGLIALAVTAATLGACGAPGAPAGTGLPAGTGETTAAATPTATASTATTPERGGLAAFADCDALTAHLQALALPRVTPQGLRQGGNGTADGPVRTTDKATNRQSTAEDRDRYGSRLQPADAQLERFATDGKLLVYLRKGILQIADVSGPEPVNRGSVRVRGVRAQGVLLAGNRVVVYGESSRTAAELDPDSPSGRWSLDAGPIAGIALLDITDRDAPRQVAYEAITGKILSTRAAGTTAHLVLTSTPDLPVVSNGTDPAREAETRERNRGVVLAASARDWLPARVVFADSGTTRTAEGPLVECTDTRFPAEDSGIDTLSALALDLTRDDALVAAGSAAVVTAGQLVRQDADRLYVATTAGGWGPAERDPYAQPTKAVGTVEPGRSTVHELDTTGTGPARYVASGAVTGYLPGGWAMSADAGNLRVATTAAPPWLSSGESGRAAAVSVLAPDGTALREVGRLDGLGGRGALFGIGWYGSLAAVMTTRQAEPVQLLDLRVPDRPQAAGTFRVDGKSAYIRPIEGHRLLVVDDGTDAKSFSTGLEFTVFDVENPAHPRRVGHFQPASHTSSAAPTYPGYLLWRDDTATAVMSAEVSGVGWDPGMISVRVAEDGKVTAGPQWHGARYTEHTHPGGGVRGYALLPTDRLVAWDDDGLWFLDAQTLKPQAFTRFPTKAATP